MARETGDGMTEPEYIYVKGQGWVINSTPTFYYTDADGNMIKAEIRMPEMDERYYRYALTSNAKFNIENVTQLLQTKNWMSWSRRRDPRDGFYTSKTCIVLTRVES